MSPEPSAGERPKNALVVYASRFGNTRRLAEAIARGLRRGGVEAACIEVDAPEATRLSSYDLVAIGGPTEQFGVSGPMKEFLSRIQPRSLEGRRAFAFDTRFHNRLAGSAAKRIERVLVEAGATLVRTHTSAFIAHGPKMPRGTPPRVHEPDQDLLNAGAEAEFEALGASLAGAPSPQLAAPA